MCCYFVRSSLARVVAAATPAVQQNISPLSAKGHLNASTNVPGSDDLNGIGVKYRYEFYGRAGADYVLPVMPMLRMSKNALQRYPLA